MNKIINISGLRFKRLLVISFNEKRNNRYYWNCLCDCGKECVVQSTKLKNSHTKSCGCFHSETTANINKTHGQANKTAEYRTWLNIKNRCNNKRNPSYKEWGAKGIKVCERWLNSFENFFLDMGIRPSKDHTIDRFPNKEGNYEPSNCRWATRKEQARNTKRNVYVWYRGSLMLLIEACEKSGVDYFSVRAKKHRKKVSTQVAFDSYLPQSNLISHSFGHIH